MWIEFHEYQKKYLTNLWNCSTNVFVGRSWDWILEEKKIPPGKMKINVSQTWIFLLNYSSNEYQSSHHRIYVKHQYPCDCLIWNIIPVCDFELLQGSPIKVVCTVFIVFYKYGQQTCHSCPVFKFKGSIETCCNDKLTKNLRLNASRLMDLGKNGK